MLTSQVAQRDHILATQYNNLKKENVPIGGVLMYGSSTIPTNFLLCNGQSISTTTYAALFAIIGYVFGGSGGSFNAPDLRDKFPIGASGTKALGTTGGGSLTLSIDTIPSHTHTLDTSGSHTHTIQVKTSGSGGGTGQYRLNIFTYGCTPMPVLDGGSHNHTGATGTIGSGDAIIIIPRFIALNYIIRY